MSVKDTSSVLKALLTADPRPEKSVHMKRFGVDFKLRAIGVKEREVIREQATYPVKGGKTQFDASKFASLIIVKGTVDPDFTDAALLEKYGPTPADVVMNLLLPGEYDRLFTDVLDLSGVVDEEEALEDAKN